MTRVAVIELDGAGGMAHYAFQMCSALASAGAEVTLHTGRHYELADLERSFAVRAEMNLWPAIESPVVGDGWGPVGRRLWRKVRRVGRGARLAWEWQRLLNRLIAERPDIAQFAILRFPFQALGLRRLRRAGVTVTQICHEFEHREDRGPGAWLARKTGSWVHHSFDLIFFHGEENRRRFLELARYSKDRTVVIRHGNEAMFLGVGKGTGDLRSRYGIEEAMPVALFFGGLRPSKGIEDLIDAFAEAAGEVDAHLLIVGQPAGVDPEELRNRLRRRRIEHRATIDDTYLPMTLVGSLMRTANVVALPYRTATASGVLQVAFAFGVPVVATAVGALSEDVEHGETGLLVAPGDGPALARALVKILSSPAEAKRMGETAAHRAMTDFGWEAIGERVLSLSEGAR